jgi:hypothetical protein
MALIIISSGGIANVNRPLFTCDPSTLSSCHFKHFLLKILFSKSPLTSFTSFLRYSVTFLIHSQLFPGIACDKSVSVSSVVKYLRSFFVSFITTAAVKEKA